MTFDIKKAYHFITRTLRERPRYGWRWLTRKWANRKFRLRRRFALMRYSWRKYNNARRHGRRRKAAKWLERHRVAKRKYSILKEEMSSPVHGYDSRTHTSSWDDRRVAAWMRGDEPGPDGRKIDWLNEIKNEGWDGELYSGWRSPEYSESLCYRICGQASCSGTCAGRASNHSQTGPPNWGAVDVVNWADFQACNNNVGGPFKNNLPYDRPHRSVTGY
jgi:hypothetical protein